MKRRRIPKAQDLLLVMAALRNYIPSTEPRYEMRRSDNGVPNLRYSAETNGLPWEVDIYLGQFYRARVGSRTGEIHRSIPALLGFLLRSLGVSL